MLAAFGMLLLVAPAQFGADVELEVPSDCTAAFADFHARLSASVVGTPSNNRRARVVIDRSGSRYRVEIRTDGDSASGTKRLSTSSCDEAVSAAIAVLALALSESAGDRAELAVHDGPPVAERGEPAGERSESAATTERAAESVGAALERASTVEAASGIDRDEPNVAPTPIRVALRAGIDAGTLAAATGYFGVLAAIPAGPFEWRALVAYGLPSVEERIDPGITELRREQFLLVDVGGCYGFGDRVWLAACAAGELNVVQHAQVRDDVSDDRAWVRVAGVLAAHVAYRGSTLQPEFELGAATAVLGASEPGSLAFRASLGIGLQF